MQQLPPFEAKEPGRTRAWAGEAAARCAELAEAELGPKQDRMASMLAKAWKPELTQTQREAGWTPLREAESRAAEPKEATSTVKVRAERSATGWRVSIRDEGAAVQSPPWGAVLTRAHLRLRERWRQPWPQPRPLSRVLHPVLI